MSRIGELFQDVKTAVSRFMRPTSRKDEVGRESSGKLVGIPEGHSGFTEARVSAQGALPDYKLELGWSRRYTVDRAQQAHAGNMLAGAIIERNGDHVVGPGFPLQVLSGDGGFNLEARKMWEEWANSPHLSDVRERHAFMPDLLYQDQVGEMRDGDSLVLLRSDGRVRLVNSVEIASPVGAYYKTTEVDGVETSKGGKHEAYWIHENDGIAYPNVRTAIHTLVRVPAKDCIFSARTPLGPRQTRGTTAFLGAFRPLEHIDGSIYSVGAKAQVAAKLVMAITKKSPIPSMQIGSSLRNPVNFLEDGTLVRLEPDEEIKPIQGADPSTDLLDYARFVTRIVSARWGLSLAMVYLDFSDQRLSDARATAIETNKITLLQQLRRCRTATEVRNWKTVQWIREGRLGRKLRARADRMPEETLMRALEHTWHFPARPLIDPLKERQADLLGIDMGAATLTEILARDGKSFAKVQRRQSLERKKRQELELPDVRSNLTREAIEAGPAKAKKKTAENDGKNAGHSNGVNRIPLG